MGKNKKGKAGTYFRKLKPCHPHLSATGFSAEYGDPAVCCQTGKFP
jgi:hypothetical protein